MCLDFYVKYLLSLSHFNETYILYQENPSKQGPSCCYGRTYGLTFRRLQLFFVTSKVSVYPYFRISKSVYGNAPYTWKGTFVQNLQTPASLSSRVCLGASYRLQDCVCVHDVGEIVKRVQRILYLLVETCSCQPITFSRNVLITCY
jgi:hypothetical protein